MLAASFLIAICWEIFVKPAKPALQLRDLDLTLFAKTSQDHHRQLQSRPTAAFHLRLAPVKLYPCLANQFLAALHFCPPPSSLRFAV